MVMAEIGASSYRRFRQTEEAEMDRLLIKYADALVRFCYSLVHNASVAEDLAAESIAILLTKRKTFQDEHHLKAYLYKIAHHKAMDHLRFPIGWVPLDDVENVLGGSDPFDGLLIKERNETIYRCMQALPPQYRKVLQLAYFDGFEPADIAAILGKTAKQVYNLLSRAKASLKQLLEKEGITYADI
jgi:RNA polymerase sigma-70 factor (ECF subfamily)